jgi:hypothetical protein
MSTQNLLKREIESKASKELFETLSSSYTLVSGAYANNTVYLDTTQIITGQKVFHIHPYLPAQLPSNVSQSVSRLHVENYLSGYITTTSFTTFYNTGSFTGSFIGSHTGSFTGSLNGVASTSSYVNWANVDGVPTFLSASVFNSYTSSVITPLSNSFVNLSSSFLSVSSSFVTLSNSYSLLSNSYSNFSTSFISFSQSVSASFANITFDTSSLVTLSEFNTLTASYVNLSTSYETVSSSYANVSTSYASFRNTYNTGSFTGSFIGELQGTASYSTFSNTSSYALTASYALNGGGSIDTSSLVTLTEFNNYTSSVVTPLSNSFVNVSTSYASFRNTYNTGSFTGSFVGNGSGIVGVITSSYAVNASYSISSSRAITSENGFPYTGSATITGSLSINNYTLPTIAGESRSVLTMNGANTSIFEIPATIYEKVKNVSGVTLQKGTPVHVTGSVGNAALVVAADAGNPSLMPATYILADTLLHEEEGYGVVLGAINGVDTSGFIEGNVVYVGVGGGYTQVRPTGSALVQPLGLPIRIGVNGSGVVLNAGVTNDLPNLQTNYFWYGGSNGVPVSASLDTLRSGSFSGSFTGSFVGDLKGIATTASYVLWSNVANAPTFLSQSAFNSYTSSVIVPLSNSFVSVSSSFVSVSSSYSSFSASFVSFSSSVDQQIKDIVGGAIDTSSLVTYTVFNNYTSSVVAPLSNSYYSFSSSFISFSQSVSSSLANVTFDTSSLVTTNTTQTITSEKTFSKNVKFTTSSVEYVVGKYVQNISENPLAIYNTDANQPSGFIVSLSDGNESDFLTTILFTVFSGSSDGVSTGSLVSSLYIDKELIIINTSTLYFESNDISFTSNPVKRFSYVAPSTDNTYVVRKYVTDNFASQSFFANLSTSFVAVSSSFVNVSSSHVNLSTSYANLSNSYRLVSSSFVTVSSSFLSVSSSYNSFSSSFISFSQSVSSSLASSGGGAIFSQSVGNNSATVFTVTHNLNKQNIFVSVRENPTGSFVYPDVFYSSSNVLALTFTIAPTTNQYLVSVTGL